jgi:hypothetical protein
MPIEANLIIAQSVLDTDEGGVSALGMGWQVRAPEPIPWALAVIVQSSRDLIGTEHVAKISLEREDGSPIDEGLAEIMEIEFPFTPAGRTEDGLLSPVVRGYGFNLLPIPLEPGVEYRFRLQIDGETHDHWTASFRTTPP